MILLMEITDSDHLTNRILLEEVRELVLGQESGHQAMKFILLQRSGQVKKSSLNMNGERVYAEKELSSAGQNINPTTESITDSGPTSRKSRGMNTADMYLFLFGCCLQDFPVFKR